jgi:hypothetical protein
MVSSEWEIVSTQHNLTDSPIDIKVHVDSGWSKSKTETEDINASISGPLKGFQVEFGAKYHVQSSWSATHNESRDESYHIPAQRHHYVYQCVNTWTVRRKGKHEVTYTFKEKTKQLCTSDKLIPSH